MPKVIDLFAGAGGLSLGASRAGFNVVAAVELDNHAMASHIANFPQSIHIQKDIMELDGMTLVKLAELKKQELAGVIGGPPCQGFSSIGHGDINDIRNQLFEKFFMLVEEIKPIFFVAENVPGIMNAKYDLIRERAFAHVQDYHLLPPISVNASEYGAPTTRTRYFFIGFREHPSIQPFTISDIECMKVVAEQQTNVQTALEGIPANIHFNSRSNGIRSLSPDYWNPVARHSQSDFFYQRVTGMRPAEVGNDEYIHLYETRHEINGCFPTKHTASVRRRYAKLAYGQRDPISKSTRLNPQGFCPTLRAGTGPEKGSFQAVRPVHYQYSRVITPREAARLQGFPDWYKLPDTIWHAFRQIGNSVSPIAAERVLSAIFQKLT
ncbi:MAG: DNA cytosine methyltransferase [Lachnospiraceae bacterium]